MSKTNKGIRKQNRGGYTITLRVYSSPSESAFKGFGTHLRRREAIERRRFYAKRIALSYFRMLEMPYKTNTEINAVLLSLPIKARLAYFAVKANAKAEKLGTRGVHLFSQIEAAKKAGLSMPFFLRYKRMLYHSGLLVTKKINGDNFAYFPERRQESITDL